MTTHRLVVDSVPDYLRPSVVDCLRHITGNLALCLLLVHPLAPSFAGIRRGRAEHLAAKEVLEQLRLLLVAACALGCDVGLSDDLFGRDVLPGGFAETRRGAMGDLGRGGEQQDGVQPRERRVSAVVVRATNGVDPAAAASVGVNQQAEVSVFGVFLPTHRK